MYGPGVFASSQLSMVPADAGPKDKGENEFERLGAERQKISVEDAYAHIRPSPTATSSRVVSPPPPPTTPLTAGKPDYGMPLPRLPVPESSHYSAVSYDPTGASPTSPAFNSPHGPQPRARDFGGTGGPSPLHQHSHSMAIQPQRRALELDDGLGGQRQQQEKESVVRAPRAPPAAGHRRSHSLSQRPSATTAGTGVLGRGWGSMFGRGNSGGGSGVSSMPTSATVTGADTPIEVDEYGVVGARTEIATFAQMEEDKQSPPAAAVGGLVSGGASLMKKFGGLLIGGAGGRAADSTFVEVKKTGSVPPTTPTPLMGDTLNDVVEVESAENGDDDHSTPIVSVVGDGKTEGEPTALTAAEEEEERTRTPTPSPSTHTVTVVTPTPPPRSAGAMNGGRMVLGSLVSQPIGGVGSAHRRAATIVDPNTRRSGAGGSVATFPSTPLSMSVSAGASASASATANTMSMNATVGSRGYHERRGSTGGAAMLIGLGSSSSAGAALPSFVPAAATTTGGVAGGMTMTMTPGRVRRPSTGFVGRFGSSQRSSLSQQPQSQQLQPQQLQPQPQLQLQPRRRRPRPVLVEGASEGLFDAAEVEGDNDDDEEEEDEEDEEDEDEEPEKEYKPVYLKGLFSVATTSSKSPMLIKVDIRRVLDRMRVQYRETKNGYECLHSPSIDVSSVVSGAGVGAGGSVSVQGVGAGVGVQGGSVGVGVQGVEGQGQVKKKVSKLSFGMKRREKEKEKERKEEGQLQQQNVDVVLQQQQQQQQQQEEDIVCASCERCG